MKRISAQQIHANDTLERKTLSVMLSLEGVDSIHLPPELRTHVCLDSTRPGVAQWAPSPHALQTTREQAQPDAPTELGALSDRDMARDLGMSVSTLQRLFKSAYGMSVMEFTRTERLKAARHLLLQGGFSAFFWLPPLCLLKKMNQKYIADK